MSVVVVATIVPAAEHRAEVLGHLETAIARVHAEDPGCELYALHEGEDRLVMIEKWASREALAAHSGSAASADLGRSLKGLLEGRPDVEILTAHAAGSTEQGSL